MKIKILTGLISGGMLFFIALSAHAFTETVSPETLKARYASPIQPKIKVLIVPGHDDDVWGTQYKGVKEADMTAILGEYLYSYLAQDPRLDVFISRTKTGGYNPVIWDYVDLNRVGISEFISSNKQTMTAALQSGAVAAMTGVPHNEVQSEIGTRLYGINKWVNENNVDIVLHIHFDDYGGRPWEKEGKYQGLTVYVPDHQYGNARASRAVGEKVFGVLNKYYPKSTLPEESEGLVEDQELIALGANNTVKAASILTEYGYIYESQFLNTAIRNNVLKDLAYQTHAGLHSFFNSTKYNEKYSTSLLPHTWKTDIKYKTSNNLDILALQAALRSQDLYPLEPKTEYDCPLSGTFGACTQASLKAFQKKYGLPATGIFGPLTRAKLNALFSK